MNTTPEIIIPFDRIGEPGWEGPTGAILQDIADTWGDEMPPPCAEQALAAAEKRLGAPLPSDLALFYRTFGVADVGEELQQLEHMAFLAQWAEGYDLWDSLSEEAHAALPRLVTFSEYLGNGNAFCFDTRDGSVWYFDHDTDPHLIKLFASVGEYLKGCLIKAQQDMFDEGEADDIVEEKLVELFGEQVVAKWLY